LAFSLKGNGKMEKRCDECFFDGEPDSQGLCTCCGNASFLGDKPLTTYKAGVAKLHCSDEVIKPCRFVIHEGDAAYLRHPIEVIRRTREGRLLCKIYDREVSIPETMLFNKAGMDYLDKQRAKYLIKIGDV
jgi:hypothetical protein